MYGWKARLAVIVPSPNTTLESEARFALPNGVALFATRVLFADPRTPSDKEAALATMTEGVHEALAQCMSLEPDAIAYACTTASFIRGLAYDRELSSTLSNISGRPFVTAAGAIISALAAIEAKNIALVTPYSAEVDLEEVAFLCEAGISTACVGGPSVTASIDKGRLPMWSSYRAALEMTLTGSEDAMVVSCTNWATLEHLETLERNLGLPVISSNQAILWQLLRSSGIRESLPGFGCLRDA